MLKIRLTRRGKKRQPFYRIVVADVQAKRDGRFVENIGWYNPLTDPATTQIDEGRALHWLSVGAQPTDAVRRLLKKQGTLERLPRVHKGESIEALVAEYEGRPLVETVVDEAAELVEEVQDGLAEAGEAVMEEAGEMVDEGSSLIEDAAEAVAEVADTAVSTVVGAAENVVETVVEAVSGDDDAETA